jgi:hypothetical protein
MLKSNKKKPTNKKQATTKKQTTNKKQATTKKQTTNKKQTTTKKQLIKNNEGGGRIANFISNCIGPYCGSADGVVAPERPISVSSRQVAPLPQSAPELEEEGEEVEEGEESVEEVEGPYLTEVKPFNDKKTQLIEEIIEKYEQLGFNITTDLKKFNENQLQDILNGNNLFEITAYFDHSENQFQDIPIIFLELRDFKGELLRRTKLTEDEKKLIRKYLLHLIYHDNKGYSIDPKYLSVEKKNSFEEICLMYHMYDKLKKKEHIPDTTKESFFEKINEHFNRIGLKLNNSDDFKQKFKKLNSNELFKLFNGIEPYRGFILELSSLHEEDNFFETANYDDYHKYHSSFSSFEEFCIMNFLKKQLSKMFPGIITARLMTITDYFNKFNEIKEERLNRLRFLHSYNLASSLSSSAPAAPSEPSQRRPARRLAPLDYDPLKRHKISQIKEKYERYNLKFVNKLGIRKDPLESYSIEMIDLYSSDNKYRGPNPTDNILLGFIQDDDADKIQMISDIDGDRSFSNYEKFVIRRFLEKQIWDISNELIEPQKLSEFDRSTIKNLKGIYMFIRNNLDESRVDAVIETITKHYNSYGFSIDEAYLKRGKGIIRLLQILFGIDVGNNNELITKTTIPEDTSMLTTKFEDEQFLTDSQINLFKAVLIREINKFSTDGQNFDNMSLEQLRAFYAEYYNSQRGGYKTKNTKRKTTKKTTTPKKIVKKLRNYKAS